MVIELKTSFDLLKDIIFSTDSIAGVFIHPYPDVPHLQERIEFGEIEEKQFRQAIHIRDTTLLPFWDSIMLSYCNRENYSTKILKSALLHNFKRDKFYIEKNFFLGSSLEEILPQNVNIAFNSEVITTNNERRHLPLLDFHIQESARNQKVVESVLKILSLKEGYLLRSGKSYHYIGKKLISEYELIDLLSKCLLFSPILDKVWIAHQLIERSCSLRLTKKYGVFPNVIKQL